MLGSTKNLKGKPKDSKPDSGRRPNDAFNSFKPSFRLPMPQTPTADLFCINKIKIFHDGSPQVALFGNPLQAADGWIINLPAGQVFSGDFTGLPLDSELSAYDLLAQSLIQQPFSAFICQNCGAVDWQSIVAAHGTPSYELADLFRDLAIHFEQQGLTGAAFAFIHKAHELRPRGPVIRKVFRRLSQQAS